MRPEVRAVYRSPHAALEGVPAAGATRQALQAGPICLMPRALAPAIAAALDALAPDALPGFDVSGLLERVGQSVRAAVCPSKADPVLGWLRDDVLGLVDLYAGATGHRILRARLQVVRDDMCRAFHVDAVAYRLVTTYRGPGTQWLAPGRLEAAPAGEPLGPQAIRQMERGTVAILRGAKAATPDRPGLSHRSPPVAGTGTVRLFLAVNEAERP